MKSIKLWPHAAIFALIIAVAAGAGVWLYQRYSTNAEAAALPYAARIQRVDGEVALSDGDYTDWRATGINEPYSVGDRIYTRENARTSLAFNGRNYARLDPNTALDAVVLTDTQTQLALRDGAAMFDVGYLPSGGLYEVGTPYGAVDFQEPGLYYIDSSRGNTIVSVLSGVAQVVGLAGSGRVSKGEMLTLLGATAADVVMSRLDGNNARYLVDDYYRYQYPNVYDGRYVTYDAYLADPYYFDPYRSNVGYRYTTYLAPGVNDLSYYGDWRDVSGYGYAWSPRVDAGWTPYSQGYWLNDYPYGPTWVSTEPWGYAPYHYGRWAFVGDRWYWVPDSANATPRYAPSLVAFVPIGDNEIGWVPLGPGDPYVYRYYDENWQPHYLTRGDVAAANLVNLAVPNAVTVVPLDAFGRPIQPGSVRHINPSALAQVRPTLEPLLLTPLRNAAIHSAWGRGKINLPPGIAKKLQDTSVIVSTAPVAPPFKKDLDKSLRVERVGEKAKHQNFKIKDERNMGAAQTDAGRKQEMDRLSKEATQGNKESQREVRQLEQQQRNDEREQQKNQRRAMPLPAARGESVGHPVKPNPVKPKERPQPQVQGPPAAKHENKQPPGNSKPAGGGGKGKSKGKP
jgi:hypothetical protein